MFNPQPFSNPVTIAGEAPSVSVGGQGRSDYWLSTLRHPETPPQQFSLSPISSPATPSSTASNHSRGPRLGDVQWSGARENYGSPLAAPDVEGFGYDSHLGDALQQRSPVRSLARLSICSASTSSSGTSSLASRGAYSCSSPESSASSPPVHTNTSMPSADALVPKLEEFEDEDQLMSTPPLSLAGPVQEPTGKRGRGRPRKHPLTIAKTVQKSTKGRSKTGCATCRRRKKKCDEAKPECNNCIKNSVQCEGYPAKTVWQAGRKTQSRGCSVSASVSITQSLPHLVEGVKNKTDRMLLDHFDKRVSRILTLHDDKNNPFHNYLLPLAMHNEALMHSLLALSSSHLSNTHPLNRDFEAAQPQHIGDALRLLREGIGRNPRPDDTHLATSLVLCLDSICRGNIEGSYKPHLNAARTMLRQHGEEINPLALLGPHAEETNPLRQFLYEFFKYHEVINSITILNDEMQFRDDMEISEFKMSPSSSPSMLGVFDGLFVHMSRIAQFRRVIRVRRMHGMQPVDGAMLIEAVGIDNDLHEWQSPHEPGSPQYIASQLYLHCTWIYLWRTIQDRDDVYKIRAQVELGLECLRQLPENSGTQSNLLMPLFMLGCAAFYPEQRPEIVERFESLQKWSGLRNVLRALNVVRKVWQLMDEGETKLSWDWEIIIKEMGYDFLIT